MNLIKKLFGQIKKTPSKSDDLSQNPNYIKVYDKFGREMYIPKDEWRKNVLPKSLKDNWDKPNELYNIIVIALEDGFATDLEAVARHLVEIDNDKGRSYCALGIILLKNNRLKEAEEVFDKYINQYGPVGYILTNLAKVYSAKGEKQKSEATLLDALRLDPNQDNALGWWGAIQNEQGGKSAYIEAMKQVSQFEGSWRAQLWLARDLLEKKDLSGAMTLYEQVLERAKEVPDALMMISGDLGNNGHISEIVRLFGSYYDPQKHGIATGMNLLEAYLQLKNHEQGEELLGRMLKLDYQPIRERLKKFAEGFRDLSRPIQMGSNIKLEGITVASIEKPLWYYMLGAPKWLIEDKPKDCPRIAFFALANTTRQDISEVIVQKEDDLGKLTRTIPLYLSEQVYLFSSWAPSAGIMLADKGCGYAVFGKECDVEYSVSMAKTSETIANYAVSGYLKQEKDNLEIKLKLIDVHRGIVLRSFEVTGQKGKIWILTEKIKTAIMTYLSELTKRDVKPPSFYKIPEADGFEAYLLGLGGLLGLSLSGNKMFPKEGLYGERSTLDFLLNLAVSHPEMQILKIMFLSGLCSNRKYNSSIYKEYEKKAFELLKDEADKNSVFAKLSPLLYKLYESENLEGILKNLEIDASPEYKQWLEKIRTF
jgi:tetratricopeptide (TPR) repeat protein